MVVRGATYRPGSSCGESSRSECEALAMPSLDRRRERLEIPALGTAIADHSEELLPARFDPGQPLLFHGTSKPRLRPTAFEVEGDALFHRSVALGTCLRLRHHS